MYTKVVNVLSNSGTGTQDITFTPNGSDPNWTPKVAIVQWSRANTSAGTYQEHASIGIGFTDGTNQRCVATASEDNQARGDSARIQRNDALICTLNPSGTIETVDAVATFTQWLQNGMQITWSDAPAAQFYLNITFLGGNDISNVDVGTLATGTGTSPISVTSLTYQPDFGLFLSGGTATENSPVVSGFMSVGAATSSSAQWVQSIYSLDNPATMSTRQYYSHGKVVVSHTTAVDGYATFTSFNSNGFTLTPTDGFPSSFPIYYLVVKGGNYAVGNNTEPGSTGEQAITTNKDTKAVMVFGLDTGTADAPQNGCMWTSGIGTASGTGNQFNLVFEDTNGVADSIIVSKFSDGYIYWNITANATAGSTTNDDYGGLYIVSSTGFSLWWTDIGQARPYRYITFGTGATVNQAPISETSVSVSDSVDPTFYLQKNISETSVTVGDGSVVGAKTFVVSISESSVTVGAEEVEAEREVERYVNEVYVDVGADTIETTELYPKSISEDSVTVGTDSIEGTKIPAGPTAQLYNVHFVEFPEDALDSSLLGIKIEGHITVPKTHKWNVIAKITASKTHKWNAVNAVSNITKTHKWNAISAVSAEKTHLYDLVSKIDRTQTHKYNIIHKITSQPKTHKWNVLSSVSTTKTHKYNVSVAIAATKTHKWNVIAKITASKTHKYSLAGSVTATRTHKWNIISTVSTTKTHVYNVSAAAEQVSTTKTHKWNVIAKVATTKTHKWHLSGGITTTRTHKWNVNNAISTTKTHKWNALIVAAKAITHKWNSLNVISKSTTHKYNTIAKVTKTKTHVFNLIASVLATKTHIYDLLEAIETVTKTHKYNVKSQVVKTKTHKYNTIGRITRTHTHRWNSGGKVLTTKRHLYNIGISFELPIGAGSSTVAHIKFPPRITILDIISDIRNRVVANIQIVPDDKIICVAVVELAEFPFAITTTTNKTASAVYKPRRHRIASTLIIPPIIDTIHNRAVSGRIGIEALEPSPESRIQVLSQTQLTLSYSNCRITSNTQIKEDPSQVIRISSNTQLATGSAKTRLASVANLQLEFLNYIQIKAPEIMEKTREQILKILIDVLRNEHIWE